MLEDKHYLEWTPKDVQNFVLSLGTGQRYAEAGNALLEAGVSGDFFITLKDDDFQDLGVSRGFDRKRILFAIDNLLRPAHSSPNSHSPKRSRSPNLPSSPDSSLSNQYSPRKRMESIDKSVHKVSRNMVPPPPPRQRRQPHLSPQRVPREPPVHTMSSNREHYQVQYASHPNEYENIIQIPTEAVYHPPKGLDGRIAKEPRNSKSRQSVVGPEPGSIPPRSPPAQSTTIIVGQRPAPKIGPYNRLDSLEEGLEAEVDEKQMDFGNDLPELPDDSPSPMSQPRDGWEPTEIQFKKSAGQYPSNSSAFNKYKNKNKDPSQSFRYMEEDLCWLCDVCSGPNDMDTLICQRCGTEHTDEPDGLELLHLQPARPNNVHEAEMDFGSNIQVLCMVNNPMPDDIQRLIAITNTLFSPERSPVYLDVSLLGSWIENSEFMEFLYLLGFEFTEQGPCCHDVPPQEILEIVINILKEKLLEIEQNLENRSNYLKIKTLNKFRKRNKRHGRNRRRGMAGAIE